MAKRLNGGMIGYGPMAEAHSGRLGADLEMPRFWLAAALAVHSNKP